MITIIFAPPGFGKTVLLTHLANMEAFNRDRIRAMQNEIKLKNENGFNLSVPIHCVASNYDMVFRKFGYSPRMSRRINPFRLGFANNDVKTHFVLPHEFIAITEGQKYFNSRKSQTFPAWVSRFYEQHRHNDLDVYIDVQRPMLIDATIRELAQFVEIQKLDIKKDKSGKPITLTWSVRRFENSKMFDKYMASGGTDKTTYQKDTIVAKYNVFELYDSQSCKPKFYAGHFDEDFDLAYSKPIENSKKGYIEALKEYDDELPPNFYGKEKGKW